MNAAAVVIPLAARITGISHRFDVARETSQTLLSEPFLAPVWAEFVNTGLALQAIVESDIQACGLYYARLNTQRNRLMGYAMAGDRVLGLLSHMMDNLDLAAEHFEDSLAFCRKAGYRPELAWTCCDYADTLLQRNNPGDRQQATSLLDESLAISSELGMKPLMERVLARRDILKA